ncbi:MAG: DeoR/GlpR family DNA-binding transcription regulator [Lachnospiraceae bacterium]|nr:DeoR/GlpR family DNA-binding transcription regulator [Lachnospiraceae bacterium]
MLALERRNIILEKLQDEKRVVVSELASQFGVSEETIRRDLEKMEKDGLVTKSYGGAILNESTSIDMPFNVRKKVNVPGKQRMAELAAGLIRNGDHIILDASSTSVFIAKAIRDKKNLTVLTNSIEIIIELSDMPDWNIICSGGSLKEGYLALVGPKALESLSSFNADKAFFSCKGIDIDRGITDGNEMFTQIKQVMMHSAARSILAVDSSKFDKIAFSRLCDVKDMQTIIMDQKPEERWLTFLEGCGIECLYPEEA